MYLYRWSVAQYIKNTAYRPYLVPEGRDFCFVKKKLSRKKRFLIALGKHVRKLRRMEKMSQKQLGFESGIHYDTIGSIERGESDPAESTIEALAHALGKTMKEMHDFDY